MLQAVIQWTDGLGFDVHIRDHKLTMDAKTDVGGKDRGPNPKELVLAGLCGCSGMDVASLLKKFRQTTTEFTVDAHSELTTGHPSIFEEIHIFFRIVGEGLDPALCQKAVDLSMNRYCGVSAMLAKATSIHYHILINGTEVKVAQANFDQASKKEG